MSTNTVIDKPVTADVVAAAAQHHTASQRAKGEARPLFDPKIVRRATLDAFTKLDPRNQARNPVMFTVLVGSILTTALWVQSLAGKGEAAPWFIFSISAW